MNDVEKLRQEVEKIKERNRRVEKDKEWETSLVRRLAIAVLTYLVVLVYFLIIKVDRPLISAAVPPLAYLISTLTFSFLKQTWLKNK